MGAALRTAIKQLKKNGTLKKIAAKHQIPVSDVK
jgi:LysM repeat protein